MGIEEAELVIYVDVALEGCGGIGELDDGDGCEGYCNDVFETISTEDVCDATVVGMSQHDAN